ncbi:hypothetical protein SPRG_07055 [Saprolegnia parasitica CBS 223.65]|uniref:ubiquitinyl hydrolase 1 n=1 Tax=Saprolegnia parasitica (strain CBS 223.65) TaxID=695850 RepID=A0A067CLN1_SAPPC|nr:hypothetical protein SPRG_07055 [Saprolegnia parasitica CBS 223.65]KDO27466.1 hypothetical protein SPRG_07055 [Saprolegnia parasitica CBS 223.65]|eukprot:XP_012201904.1 hypothetical protein SPRG_07055 [Saprolegnia parasitica CBS 223.65]
MTATVESLRQLMWGASAVYESEEELRWQSEDFCFCPLDGPGPTWGLQQTHGGPCGVFAPVQARMLVHLLGSLDTPLTGDARERLLASVLAAMLLATTEAETDPIWFIDAAHVSATASGPVRPIAVARADLEASVRDFFVAGKGVLSFVYSMVLTRGVDRLRGDMDDMESSLTMGEFGHGTQELLNLMLTGRGTSNVFDDSVPMGDTGLVLRGVSRRPLVGYLTQLEALRYCAVGSYYKTPLSPIWVLGSASHFTVLFSPHLSLVQESNSDALLSKVTRAFKQHDTMESGFIALDALLPCLQSLGVDQGILSNQYQMGRLFAKLEVPGAGIVLWDDFWRVVSVLLETNDLQQAINGKVASRQRSDSDLARELQAQFDSGQTAAAEESAELVPMAADTEDKVVFYHYNGLVDSRQPNTASRAL